MAHFQRTKSYAYVKLGSRQKSMRKYRRPTGRHNKARQKWKSRGFMVQIGYKNKVETRGLINEKKPVLIYTLKNLENIQKDNIAIIGKIGAKLKAEIAREMLKRKIEAANLNITKFLKNFDRINKEAKK